MEVTIKELQAEEFSQHLHDLAELLVNVVEKGASVGFLRGVSLETTCRFWSSLQQDIDSGTAVVIAALVDGHVRGSTVLKRAMTENGRHRAEIVKVLVHSEFRRQGIGERLIRYAEEIAVKLGHSLLVLDTETFGEARRLYGRLGWIETGNIPDYALSVDGDLVSTTVMYRLL